MIINYTPFAVELMSGWDHQLFAYHAVVIRACFVAASGAELRLAAQQGSSPPADVFWGEPGGSSVRYEADIAPEKPRVDVLINGHAYAPAGAATRHVSIRLQVGDIAKSLVVSGDQIGRFEVRPFTRMPLVYERAFGGVGKAGGAPHPGNPVGLGYQGGASPDRTIETRVPNIRYPDERAEPAGFGVVARSWQPRLALAGTYGDAWLADRFPLLPTDFDPAHHQCAPMDQQSETLAGGEICELQNLTPDGIWRFRVPKLRVPMRFWYADRGELLQPRLDTILIEPDLRRVTLIARCKLRIRRGVAPLRQIIVGHVTAGWWRARLTDRYYWDLRGTDGRDASERDYEL